MKEWMKGEPQFELHVSTLADAREVCAMFVALRVGFAAEWEGEHYAFVFDRSMSAEVVTWLRLRSIEFAAWEDPPAA